jgi:hypothetical protein
MGKGSSAPDPYQTANAQSGANYTNAQYGVGFQNWDQYSPEGSQTYKQNGWNPVYNQQGQITGYAPRYSSTIKLSPGEEALRLKNQKLRGVFSDVALNQAGRLGSTYSKDLSTAGLTPWKAAAAPGAVRQDQAPTDRRAVEAAMMGMFDKDAVRQNAAQEAQAMARGMTPGGVGYGRMVEGQRDARTEALQRAFLGSGAESRAAQDAFNQAAQQKYTMGADWAAQLNNLRQQQFVEKERLYDKPAQIAASMMGFSGPNTPTFTPFSGSSMGSAPNIGDYIYNSAAINQQGKSDFLSGIFGVGSAVAGAMPWASWLSDRRLKTNIRRINATLAGVPVYLFRYRKHNIVPKLLQRSWRMGVMADEVRPLHPDAVLRGQDGYDRVNYELLYERHAHG